MYWLAVLLGLFPLAQQAAAQAVPPPSNGVPTVVPASPAQPFDEWLQGLIDEARARGFSNEIVDETLKGLEPLPRVIERDRSQAELRPGFNRYSSSHLTRAMVDRGRDLSRENASILQRLETDYEVQRRFVVAIWGMESRYGRFVLWALVFSWLGDVLLIPKATFLAGLGSFLVADVKFDGEDLIGKAAHEVGERPGVPGGGSYAVATPEGGQGEFVADTGGGSGDEPGPACRCVPVSHATLLSE